MTRITHETYYDTHFIECTGHAGNSLLCAAVSMLCHTLAEYLERMRQADEVEVVESALESGRARFTFNCGENSRVLEGISAIFCGFEALAAAYPDHILAECE